ncbi:hypothetical protein V2G26_005978 [Clonostachys chloroleuca]
MSMHITIESVLVGVRDFLSALSYRLMEGSACMNIYSYSAPAPRCEGLVDSLQTASETRSLQRRSSSGLVRSSHPCLG